MNLKTLTNVTLRAPKHKQNQMKVCTCKKHNHKVSKLLLLIYSR